MQDESLAIRNAATILFKVLGGKENIDQIWPLNGAEKQSRKFEQPSKEWWAKMKAAQIPIDKKIQDKRMLEKR